MYTSLLGVISAIALVWFSVSASGEVAAHYWNPAGIAIVVGGVAASALLAFRPRQIGGMVRSLSAVFQPDPPPDGEVHTLVEFAGCWVRKDLKGAEGIVARTGSPFLRVGLQLVLDNTPLDDLMRTLGWRIMKFKEQETGQARLFRTLAGFAPAFGMLGTLVGLIGMLAHFEEAGPEALGANMAIALITTVYGLLLANLVFKPISIKLEQRALRRVALLNVLMDGVILIRLGRGPTSVEDAMQMLLADTADEVKGHA